MANLPSLPMLSPSSASPPRESSRCAQHSSQPARSTAVSKAPILQSRPRASSTSATVTASCPSATQLTPPESNIDPQANPNVESLFNFVTHLDSSLSPSAWQDRNIKSYVPSHYRACVSELGTTLRPVPDLSVALAQHLPAATAQLLAGSQLIPGFGHCTDLTAADARSLAEGLFNAGIGHNPSVPWPQYRSDVTDGTPPTIDIDVEPLLPDGSPLMGPGSLLVSRLNAHEVLARRDAEGLQDSDSRQTETDLPD